MAKTMTTAEFGKMLHAWKREKEDNAFAFEERKHLRTLTRQLKSIPTTREGKVELRREMKKIIKSAKMFASNPDYRRELLVKDFTSLGLFMTAIAETRTTDAFGRTTYDMERASALVDSTREDGSLGLGNSAVTNGEFMRTAERIVSADGAVNSAVVELEAEALAQEAPDHTMDASMNCESPAPRDNMPDSDFDM